MLEMDLSSINNSNFSDYNLNIIIISNSTANTSASNENNALNTTIAAVNAINVRVNITFNYDSVNNSVGNEQEENLQLWEKIVTYYLTLFMFFLIFVTGFIGNGALVLIFIVQRRRLMLNASNIYISSLAVGDLLLIMFGLPFISSIYIYNTWSFGKWICKMMECVKDISLGVSVFTLTALSIDRYFAIVSPLKKFHSTFGKKKVGVVVTIIIWVMSVIFATPAAIHSYVRKFNQTSLEVCYPYTDEWISNYPQIVVIAKFFIYYAIPLTIIAVFYALIAYHLRRSIRILPQRGQLRQINVRKKVAITVFVFVLIFAICFLPHHIFMLWFYINPNAEEEYDGFWNTFRILGTYLSFFNSCINPIALYCVSETFREKFKNLFRTCLALKTNDSSKNKFAKYKYKPYRYTQNHGDSTFSTSIQMSVLHKQAKSDFQLIDAESNAVLLRY